MSGKDCNCDVDTNDYHLESIEDLQFLIGIINEKFYDRIEHYIPSERMDEIKNNLVKLKFYFQGKKESQWRVKGEEEPLPEDIQEMLNSYVNEDGDTIDQAIQRKSRINAFLKEQENTPPSEFMLKIYPVGWFRRPLIDINCMDELKEYYERYKWDIVDCSDEEPASWNQWMESEHYYILTGQMYAEHHEVLNS